MRTLSKVGWYCMGLALILWIGTFAHYNGFNAPLAGLFHLLAVAFWGGLVLAGAFLFLMALLFLSN